MRRIFAVVLAMSLLLGALLLISCNATQNQAGGSTNPPDSTTGGGSTNPSGDTADGSVGLTYALNSQGDGYIVTGMGTCTDTRVVIPSTYNGLPVISIAKGAFQAYAPPVSEKPSEDIGKDKDKDKDKYKSSSIGAIIDPLSAFIPLSEETGEITSGAENPEANITEVVIPDSVMDIGDEAFYGCEKLESVSLSDKVTTIGASAFNGCAALTSIAIPGVGTLGEGAFYNCSALADVQMGENVEEGNYAFFNTPYDKNRN